MILAFDIGTTQARLALLDRTGSIEYLDSIRYEISSPKPAYQELDPYVVLDAVYTLLLKAKELLINVNVIIAASQGEAAILLDKDKKVVHNSILTFDPRSEKETQSLSEEFDKFDVYEKTGMPLHSMFTLPKLMWLKKNKDLARVHYFFCYSDFILYQLGARYHIDYSLASRTLMFDQNQLCWDETLVSHSGLNVSQMPQPVVSGSFVGYVNKFSVERFNLNPNCIILSGMHDQLASAIGANFMRDQSSVVTLGSTSSAISLKELSEFDKIHLFKSNVPFYPYLSTTQKAFMTFLPLSGELLQWYMQKILNNNLTLKELDGLAIEKGRGIFREDLFFIPFLAGIGTPNMNSKVTGEFRGLTIDANYLDLYVAIIEGICFEIKRNISLLPKTQQKHLTFVGGGTNSRFWLQTQANILGRPIYMSKVSETAIKGLAYVANGFLNENTSSVRNDNLSVNYDETEVKPNPYMQKKYSEKYERYLSMVDEINQN